MYTKRLMSSMYVVIGEADIFKRFTNKEGKFNDSITNDVQGMLSLYEASHLMVHGDPILEEALALTRTNLQSSMKEVEK